MAISVDLLSLPTFLPNIKFVNWNNGAQPCSDTCSVQRNALKNAELIEEQGTIRYQLVSG